MKKNHDMNKNELVHAIAESIAQARLADRESLKADEPTTTYTKHKKPLSPKAIAEKSLEAIMTCMTDALKDGDIVKLVGFGTFKTRLRKANVGRNPRTGEAIQIPERRLIKFDPGLALREAVENTKITPHIK